MNEADQDTSATLSPENILAVIYSDANRNRLIWTASIVLRCLAIAFYPHIPASLHKRANRSLKALWRDGKLVRRTDLRRDHRIPEVAYMRPEDKPPIYFESCGKCGFPRMVRNGTIEPCRRCAGDEIDENDYWPIFTSP